jgi:transcriptional regulator with XRE-family HTH domain
MPKLKTISRSFAPAIKSLRRLLDETQEGMARRLGLKSVRAYQFWESGRSTPSGGNLEKLSRLAEEEGIQRIQWAMTMEEYGDGLRTKEDEETRAAFGLESGISNLESPLDAARRQALKSEISNLQSGPPLAAGRTGEKLDQAQEDRLRQLSDAIEGLNQVYEAAQAGHPAADELLRSLAHELTVRGGDWRTMRYAHTTARKTKSKK